MAEQNAKDFAINWIFIGVLFTALLTFAVNFMVDNNASNGFTAGTENIFNTTRANTANVLIQTQEQSNVLLNVTANTNPEASYLGSRDSVATSFRIIGQQKNIFETAKPLILWIFSGVLGQFILALLGGVFSFLAIYFIWKWIKQGG